MASAAAGNAARILIRAVSQTGITPGGHQRPLRAGVIAVKLGMSAFWDQFGARHALTLLQVKTYENDGYSALQVGAVNRKLSRANRAEVTHANKAGTTPKRHIQEFRVTEECVLEPGTELRANHFKAGQFVDVTATSIGKGFQGPMKRWGFKGQSASHGNSLSHRSHGSTGHRKTPSKTWKGKKMAGHMGCDRITVLGLRVVQVDPVNNLIVVKGHVPGSPSTAVRIRDAIRMSHHKHNVTLSLPLPTAPKTEDAPVEWAPPTCFRNPFLPEGES